MIRKKSIRIAGHATSISIEDEFWTRLTAMAERRGVSLSVLITEIDAQRKPDTNLSSALRVFVLENTTLSS